MTRGAALPGSLAIASPALRKVVVRVAGPSAAMPESGVIFSDGVEADYLEFNSGTIARFSVSQQRARLVVG